MPILPKDAKILWAHAAGRCSFEHCHIKLTADTGRAGSSYTLGEMAHIKGDKRGSNRYDPEQSQKDRDSYPNLILLCPTHQTLIDKPENETTYPVELLHSFKATHEAYVQKRLTGPVFATKEEVAKVLLPALIENHEAFFTYGPLSKLARENPQSEAHGVWLEERLVTIAPNNRAMADLLRKNLRLFSTTEIAIIMAFIQHARSYDRWVNGETSYEGVPRFPVDFSDLMERLAQ